MSSFRTLIRFCMEFEDTYFVVIPAWNHKKYVPILKKTIPKEILDFINSSPKNIRVHANVNWGEVPENSPEFLRFENWEVPNEM